MARSLIWIDAETQGWACSDCQWRFPVPTLLTEEEAKRAYDRLAASKFRDHLCWSDAAVSSTVQEATQEPDSAFAERARMLIKRGYKPKVAVDLVLTEMEFEHRNNPSLMDKVRADADDFLARVRKGIV